MFYLILKTEALIAAKLDVGTFVRRAVELRSYLVCVDNTNTIFSGETKPMFWLEQTPGFVFRAIHAGTARRTTRTGISASLFKIK